jgi:guanine deaminase
MDEAVKESILGVSLGHGFPFGAVIVKDNEIIGRGHNQNIIDNDISSHAEIVALRNAAKALKTRFLDGCEIYTSTEPVIKFFNINKNIFKISALCVPQQYIFPK